MSDKDLEDDGLTDEERAALAEEDGTDTPAGELDIPEGEGEGAGEGSEDDAAAAAEAEAKAKADADAAAAAAGRDDGAAEGTTPPETALPDAPILVAEAPTDAAERLAEIATKKNDLISQFDDGDITAKEYQQELDKLAKQERDIEFAVNKAQMAADMEKQRKYNEWLATVNGFLNEHKFYKENPRLYRALDQEVKDVSATPEAANWDGNQILKKAHDNLTVAFNLQPAGKSDTPTPVPKPTIPPSLAKIPAADNNDMGGGKYAALDRLANTNPIAYEEAIAKMSDADRDAYLASA